MPLPYPDGLPIQTIWDEIAYFLESTKDLLSLALTCHTFKELIIPDHLEYRYIHCDLCRGDVWRGLASRPRLARRIRSLKLLDEPHNHGRTLLPQDLTHISPDHMISLGIPPEQRTTENLVLFKSALSHMASLKYFTWSNPFETPSAEELIDTSRVLTNTTHCLEALFVGFGLSLLRGNHRQLLENLSIWTLTGLKKVNIHYPGAAAIHMILNLCPEIEDIRLTGKLIDTVSVFHIMQHANWKKLRRLYFCLVTSTRHEPAGNMDTATIITSFLDRHANLESIHLELFAGSESIPTLPASRLPKLRSIGSGIYNYGPPLPSFLSSGIISRLVHWKCPIVNLNIDILPHMYNLESACLLRPHMSHSFNARSITNIVPFLSKTPNLKRIYLGGPMQPHMHKELINIYLKYANCLTHIFCEYSLDSVANDTDLHEKLDSSFKILSTLRSLTYFRIITDGGRKLLVKIKRDEEGLYSGYQNANLKEAGGDPDCWGNFFSDF